MHMCRDLVGVMSGMDFLAWRGMAYTLLPLNFVFACQLLLLQPLVSAFDLLAEVDNSTLSTSRAAIPGVAVFPEVSVWISDFSFLDFDTIYSDRHIGMV